MTKCYVCPIDLIFLQPQTHPGIQASSRHHQTPSRHPQIPSWNLQILVFLQVRGYCKQSQYLSIITKYYVCQRYLILKQPQTHLDTNIIQTGTIRHHPGLVFHALRALKKTLSEYHEHLEVFQLDLILINKKLGHHLDIIQTFPKTIHWMASRHPQS